jgi:hypothetical protein
MLLLVLRPYVRHGWKAHAFLDAGETLDNVTSGFVETYGVGVCAGAYSPALLAEWHRWDQEHGSENEPVDCFDGLADQLFVVGSRCLQRTRAEQHRIGSTALAGLQAGCARCFTAGAGACRG